MDEKRNLRVLLIEDNPGDAFLIKFYLQESSYSEYEVIHEEELNKALEKIQVGEKYDVILSDLHVLDSQGLATLERILEVAPNQLVIVMTGLNDEEIGLQALKLGAQDYLVKGQFDGKVFNSSIRYAYERFLISEKLRHFANHLDTNNLRFRALEKLSQTGYFEIDKNVQEVLVSSNTESTLLKVQDNKMSYETFASLFKDREAIFSAVKDSTGIVKIKTQIAETSKEVEISIDNDFTPFPNSYSGIIKSL